MKKKNINKKEKNKNRYNHYNGVVITIPLLIYMITSAGSSVIGVGMMLMSELYKEPNIDPIILWFFTFCSFMYFMFIFNLIGIIKTKT